MTDPETTRAAGLAPVSGRARIDVLDVLRGIAILGIFYMNIPFMGGSILAEMVDPRLQGWMPADRLVHSLIAIMAEGTQRGMLEMLFGAGMMILTARAMTPDGPVAVADLYMRRTLWLLVFGLLDIFVVLWPGDILHTYALAALFLFPFRRMVPKALVAIGLLLATAQMIGGGVAYVGRTHLIERVAVARTAEAAHRPLTTAQRADIARLDQIAHRVDLTPEQRQERQEEVKARTGGLIGYAGWLYRQWFHFAAELELPEVVEAFSTMLLGIALFKWGVIQGERGRRFYLLTAIACYAFGIGARWIGVNERLTFQPIPKTIWMTEEYARLAVTLGHVCLVNLLLGTGFGRVVLSPFKAAGRTAFSLYVLTSIIGMWILFPGFGFGLWDRFGWAGLAAVATATIAGLLVVANVWVLFFVTGPLEWAWRSLAYWRRQPFRVRRTEPEAIVVGP